MSAASKTDPVWLKLSSLFICQDCCEHREKGRKERAKAVAALLVGNARISLAVCSEEMPSGGKRELCLLWEPCCRARDGCWLLSEPCCWGLWVQSSLHTIYIISAPLVKAHDSCLCEDLDALGKSWVKVKLKLVNVLGRTVLGKYISMTKSIELSIFFHILLQSEVWWNVPLDLGRSAASV